MTHKEKIIATAYTGIMFVDGAALGDVYAYEEEKLGRGVIDIMHANKGFQQEVRDAVRDDFLAMISGEYALEKRVAFLGLSADDIRIIVEVAEKVIEETPRKELVVMGKDEYYTRVLERVNKYFECGSNKAMTDGSK